MSNREMTLNESEYMALEAAIDDLESYYSGFLRELDMFCRDREMNDSGLSRTA